MLLKLFCGKLLIPYTTEYSPSAYLTHSIRFPGSGKFGVRCFQKYCLSFNSERSVDGIGKSCCQNCIFPIACRTGVIIIIIIIIIIVLFCVFQASRGKHGAQVTRDERGPPVARHSRFALASCLPPLAYKKRKKQYACSHRLLFC